jgi:NAD(P)-dependent dehydrogenase (short-subunit alcohol dehydrogenase family)
VAAALHVLTGASRGMGAAMAEQLLKPGHVLLCISRHTRDSLDTLAREAGARCEQWAMDLSDPRPVAQRLAGWLAEQAGPSFQRVALINNAGVISRIGAVGDSDPADLANAMRVGLEAPVLLTSAFLRGTRDWNTDRRVLNISSGLGRRAMAGSASYCAAKAGLDHFTRAVALEEALHPRGARIVSLAPGVIDTDMQVQLRGADPAGFPDHGRFVQLRDDGALDSPHQAAAKVLAFLGRPDFGQQPVADVRD